MAFDILKLDSERQAGGAALLRMLDGVEFGAVGAAWVYLRDTEHWHYLVVTPMVDSEGPHWIYERLLQVFNKLELPKGVTPLDIVVASPHEQAILTLRNDLSVLSRNPKIHDSAFMIGRKMDVVFAYRFPVINEQLSDPSHRFNLRVRQLSAA